MSDLFVLIAALVILVVIAFFAFRRRPRKRWIVIDGSNVLYWAGAINLPAKQVLVAPKGTPADPLLLEGAAMLKARVITNDRFRDWEEAHPEVREAGFLVRGRIDGKVIRLEL